MGKSSGSAPQSPDPNVTIPLQTAANKDQLAYSLQQTRTNSVGPNGSQTWSTGPNGTATQTTSLTPGAQDTLNNTTETGQYKSNLALQLAQGLNGNNSLKGPLDAGAVGQVTGVNDPTLIQHAATSRNLVDPTFGQLNAGSIGSNSQALSDQYGNLNSSLAAYQSKIGAMNPQQYSQQASDAAYNQATRYLDPQQQQAQQKLTSDLAAQGFVPGTPGYQQAMENFQNTNNQAYAQARDAATTQGFQVGNQQYTAGLSGIQAQIASALNGASTSAGLQGQNFGQQSTVASNQNTQGLEKNAVTNQDIVNQNNNIQQINASRAQQQGLDINSANFQNQARAAQIAQSLQERSAPIDQINALLNGTAAQQPTGASSGQGSTQGADVLGAYNSNYQGQVGAYNAQVGSNNATTLGIGQLALAAASLFKFSDARLKSNIRPAGTTPGGLKLYDYEIFGRSERGILAQEHLDSDFVSIDPESGFYLVDYSKVW